MRRAADDGTGYEIWKSDGTAAGTVPLKQLPFSCPYCPYGALTNVDGRLLFSAGDQLWRSDGTEAGTRPIQGGPPHPSSFTLAGGHVFFSADAGGTGTELWALPLATACRGDCGGDGVVTISDLITAVNVALGRSLPSACQSLDTNDDGSLMVDEKAVRGTVHRRERRRRRASLRFDSLLPRRAVAPCRRSARDVSRCERIRLRPP